MVSLEKIVSLAKRRGFVFQGSEIYGGLAGTWDYGPLGVLMKENIKREWWRAMLEPHVFALDSAILANSKVWEASGHVENFSDPLGEQQFNLMFKTHAGALENESATVYLRPETAQGIFINFKNVVDAFHPKLAFGIAQIGKAFRNEITPRNFLFRSREFEQMELEYFCEPKNADKYFSDIRTMRMKWFTSLGIKKENLQFHDYGKDELAHYAGATTDIEYRYGLSESGFSELEGIANRTDFDLKNHFPGCSWIDNEFVAREGGFVPYVIEPSVGIDRAFLAFLMDAYAEDEVGGEKRMVLKLHPKIAPVKVAVFPLVGNKENIMAKAREVFDTLRKDFTTRWDDIGNIGKRYRRQDEIGTPWCVTIDYQTLEDSTVTIRDRDTAKQERVEVKELLQYIQDRLK